MTALAVIVMAGAMVLIAAFVFIPWPEAPSVRAVVRRDDYETPAVFVSRLEYHFVLVGAFVLLHEIWLFKPADLAAGREGELVYKRGSKDSPSAHLLARDVIEEAERAIREQLFYMRPSK